MCTVRKEIKCSGDSEILYDIVRDTPRISSSFFDFRVVSRTILCCISESPKHLIFFLTVWGGEVSINAATALQAVQARMLLKIMQKSADNKVIVAVLLCELCNFYFGRRSIAW